MRNSGKDLSPYGEFWELPVGISEANKTPDFIHFFLLSKTSGIRVKIHNVGMCRLSYFSQSHKEY